MVWIRTVESHDVGPTLRSVEAGGRHVLVGRLLGGEVIACAPYCPHRGLPLEGGAVYRDYLVCPNHHYTFDAYTGENLYPKRVFPRDKAGAIRALELYAAKDQEGWVWVDVGGQKSG